jgi:hypothetical protein
MSSPLFGYPGIAVITANDGVSVSVVPGLPATDVSASAVQTANVTALYTDTDTFASPTIAVGPAPQILLPGLVDPGDIYGGATAALAIQYLTPSKVDDTDTVFAPSGFILQALLPQRVTDTDTFLIHNVTATSSLLVVLFNDTDVFYLHDIRIQAIKKGKQSLDVNSVVPSDDVIYPPTNLTGRLQPPLWDDPESVKIPTLTTGPVNIITGPVPSDDVIYPSFVGRYLQPAVAVVSDDVVYPPTVTTRSNLLPAPVTDTETFYRPLISYIVQPPRWIDVDGIPIANVGWKVFASFTDPDDTLYTSVAKNWNYIRPLDWLDEETIDTYPFFIQGVQGGTPVPPPPNVLTGSFGRPKKTGSLKKQLLLTGSITHKAS